MLLHCQISYIMFSRLSKFNSTHFLQVKCVTLDPNYTYFCGICETVLISNYLGSFPQFNLQSIDNSIGWLLALVQNSQTSLLLLPISTLLSPFHGRSLAIPFYFWITLSTSQTWLSPSIHYNSSLPQISQLYFLQPCCLIRTSSNSPRSSNSTYLLQHNLLHRCLSDIFLLAEP